MKKILIICFLIIVTIACIFMGINTRKENRIKLTELSGKGYIIETVNNNLIIIDGGNKSDAEALKKILDEKENYTIIGWFLTSIIPEKSGVLCEIINTVDSINISNIFIENIDDRWYENNNFSKEQKLEIENIVNTIKNGKYEDIVTEMVINSEYQMENLYVKPLETKEEHTENNMLFRKIILQIKNNFQEEVVL